MYRCPYVQSIQGTWCCMIPLLVPPSSTSTKIGENTVCMHSAVFCHHCEQVNDVMHAMRFCLFQGVCENIQMIMRRGSILVCMNVTDWVSTGGMARDGAGSFCMFFSFFLVHIAVVTWMMIGPPYTTRGNYHINWTGWMIVFELWKYAEGSVKVKVNGVPSLSCFLHSQRPFVHTVYFFFKSGK